MTTTYKISFVKEMRIKRPDGSTYISRKIKQTFESVTDLDTNHVQHLREAEKTVKGIDSIFQQLKNRRGLQ